MDDRIYQIESSEEVLERAASMLKRCRKMALIDAFPTPLALLRPHLERMRKRNIQIALKIYRKDPIQVTLNDLLQSVESGLLAALDLVYFQH